MTIVDGALHAPTIVPLARAPHDVVAEHAREGRLAYQVDPHTHRALNYGRAVAPSGAVPEWKVSAGLGTIFSVTTVPRKDAPADRIVLVDLDEGFRLLSRVEEVAEVADAALIGCRVAARFVADREGDPYPVFVPDASPAPRPAPVPEAPSIATSTDDLRGRTAIVGIGMAGIPLLPPGSTPIDVMALAAKAALDDAGLSIADVDGVFAAGLQSFMPTLNLCEYLGIQPRYSDSTQVGGGAFVAQLNHARAAIAAGLCDVALIAYGSTQRSGGKRFVSHSEPSIEEAPYRLPGPVASYALVAQRHMHAYGTTRAQLAEVAVGARLWGALNPDAMERTPITVDDVIGARPVASPFTVRDCCLVTDGGGAIVVVSAERARHLRRPPVHVLGVGEAVSHRHIAQMPDLTTTAAVASGARAFAGARLTPRDVDVIQIYDAFTIMPPVFLEDLGFCAKGEGGPMAASSVVRPGGSLPMNTSGGGLAFCHPGMFGIFTLIESVVQLRGDAGARQVPDATVALAHAPGGFMSSQSTAILGSASALR